VWTRTAWGSEAAARAVTCPYQELDFVEFPDGDALQKDANQSVEQTGAVIFDTASGRRRLRSGSAADRKERVLAGDQYQRERDLWERLNPA
jgi:hypothetical protein